MSLPWLQVTDPFPSPLSYSEPDPEVPGLIAISTDISSEQLKRAYSQGIFPWYSESQPILWWSPNPRMVLKPSHLKISKSLKKEIKHILMDQAWDILVDCDFHATILACAKQVRKDQNGTWITHAIMHAYGQLHEQGLAHSVEVFYQGQRVGGLYCVNIGLMVFGESMFSLHPNASKLALAALCAWGIENQIALIDCQQETAHLTSMGASPIDRSDFIRYVEDQSLAELPKWSFDKQILSYWLGQTP
jgi:leucyl/phenylalanyl-tRNA--protein transferase